MTLDEFKETLKTTKANMDRIYATKSLPENFRTYCYGIKAAMEITLEMLDNLNYEDDGK